MRPKRTTLNVLVATPFGRGGKGGIDRVMHNLDASAKAAGLNVRLKILPTRGEGHVLAMVPLMMRFVMQLVFGRMTGNIDLVHINVSQRGSVTRKAFLAATCGLLGLPYVLHVHGSQFHTYWEQGGRKARVRLKNLIGGASRIIVLGEFWRQILLSIGTDPTRLAVVPNASWHPPVGNSQSSSTPARIVFLGRMGERKGTPQLVEALGSLDQTGLWRATLAGDGIVEETRARVGQLGLADRVNVQGWASADQVAELLASNDILVLPSFDENLPMSVIEGMAHGLAVIATPVGAVKDIITDGINGLIVSPGDVVGLANALEILVNDSGLRSRLGTHARAFHGRYLDNEGYAGRILDVWTAALQTFQKS